MTTETALELTKRINELQKKAETQIAIDGIEASTLDSKRKFVEILLNNYFGNKEFFDLFGPVRRSQIGKNGRTFISGYVSNSEFQALCSFYGDSPNNEHPILRRTEDTQAKLYTTTDVLGAEILEIESENIVLRDNTFYEIGADI